MRVSAGVLLLMLISSPPAFAQNENRVHRDFRVEGDSLQACTAKKFSIAECGQTLVMGQPMHFATGSLAPQNGVGFGLAFVEHWNDDPKKKLESGWRNNINLDAVATLNGSWRAGAYIKAYRLLGKTAQLEFPGAGGAANKPKRFSNVAPLFNFYAQGISLTRVDYFGLGSNSTPLSHTTYGFTETIAGVDAAIPVNDAKGHPLLAIVAEMNGRFPLVRPGTDSTLPSIGQFFTEATAPGLTRQAAYLQLSEGLRIDPALFADRIRLNYLLQFQQFMAPDTGYSFRRWNADFSHEIPLYGLLSKSKGELYSRDRATLITHNGPDDCTGSGSNISKARQAKSKKDEAQPCPIISTTQKLEGSITLRAFISESFAGQGSAVPFYLSPTLGGSNIDGTSMLASYPDYRFRGPDLLLFRGSLEHSLGKLPVGCILSADAGKVGVNRGDVSLDHLRHTFTAGVTLHAGGLPLVMLVFAWGGKEGTHAAATISPTLLGASSRPSLF